MKQIKILGLALVAILALAAASMATSAMAVELELPDIHVVLGEAFPVMGEGELLNEGKIVAFIESEIGTKITATHLHVKLELTKLSPLGPLTLLEFRGFGLGATLCNTEGDGAGIVLVPSEEYHVVAVPLLVGTEKVLDKDILILFKAFTLICGKIKIKLTGPVLFNLVVTPEVQVTKFGITAKCVGKGKQEYSTFFNDLGEEKTKQLLKADFGLGAENACEQLEKELTINLNKMVEFLKL